MLDATRRQALRIAAGTASVVLGGAGVASADRGADTPPGRTAAVRFDNQTVSGSIDEVDVAEAFLPEGGYVIVHTVADNELGIGPPVGATDELHRGANKDVTAHLAGSQYGGLQNDERTQSLIAMPHRDDPDDGELTFPDGDPPYVTAGAPVIDIGVVTVE